MQKENVKLINQRIALEKVVFEKKEFLQTTLKVNVKDSLININTTGQDISFTYVRKACLDPASIFEVVVEISYSSKFDDESYKLFLEKNKPLTKDDLINIVNNTIIPQTASMIISNLTSVNGGNPLITVPGFAK